MTRLVLTLPVLIEALTSVTKLVEEHYPGLLHAAAIDLQVCFPDSLVEVDGDADVDVGNTIRVPLKIDIEEAYPESAPDNKIPILKVQIAKNASTKVVREFQGFKPTWTLN